ncbi:MAG: hypothetical protein KJ737_19670 [Proteobacteria bacterium]|nr:hypothetical protein [Pseudomonadota bacterium]
MEDITRNMEREIESGPSETDFSKRVRRWDILMVGDDGKVISVPWFKKMIVYVLVLFAVVTLLCLSLFVMYQSAVAEKNELRASLEAAVARNMMLQTDIDKKMARLVAIEKKNAVSEPPDETMTAVKEIEVKKPTLLAKLPEKTAAVKPQVTGFDDEPEEMVEDESPEEKIMDNDDRNTESNEMAPASYKAEIEEFSVARKAYNNSLRIRFIIKNSSSNVQPISGNIFVILKPDDLNEAEWLSVPTVHLMAGKPTESKRGQFFSIRRFKTVRFIVTEQADYDKFKKATVFVYASSGDLILEKDFVLNFNVE